MANKMKTKCDFCRYWTGKSCMATPNSAYCREATDEYYKYIRESKPGSQPVQKSLRSWERR